MIDKLKKILEDGEQRIAKTLSETELQLKTVNRELLKPSPKPNSKT